MITARPLFDALADLIPAAIEREYGSKEQCILATRLALEVAAYFGVRAKEMAVRVILYNAAFAQHVKDGDQDVKKWFAIDGSHSVGIGFGEKRPGRWVGHLIAAAEDCFGDFSIEQAERPQYNLITGRAVVGPLNGQRHWTAVNQPHGTVVEYEVTNDVGYIFSPDWRDEKRRRRLAGPLIRAVREKF